MKSYNATQDLLDRNVESGLGERTAFSDPARSITYAELLADTQRCANLLRELGVRREERIAMVMLDTVEWPVVFLGAIRAGIVPVPLNTLLLAEQYAYMLADSRARVLFVAAALLPVVDAAMAKLSERPIIVVAGETDARDAIGFASALAAQPTGGTIAATHPDEPAFWLYSSGSTGMPKGARHVHTSMMATARLYGQDVLGIRRDDVCYSAAKLFFAYGLGNSLSFPMSVGARTVLNPARPTPAAVFEFLKLHQPTLFFGVPTLYAAMLGDKTLADEPGSARLRQCVSAGEALPAHIGEAWRKRFGVDILDGVGTTEMLHIFLSNRPGEVVYGTSGMPVPGYDLRLVDETGHEVAEGEIGELLVHGDSSADGYWNQREKSRATFQGDWTRTGDKYTRGADGRYHYCGRSDDMFKVGGQWVSPFEVEAALATHEAVLEAAVVAAEDDSGLLKPKAFVVLKQGAKTEAIAEALKEHVKGKVGAWKYPRWVVVVDSLPKTATGKIQRFKLREASSAPLATAG